MVGRKRPEVETEIKKRYERRIDNWKKEGFDTSELEKVLDTDLKNIKKEFDKFRRKVYRLKDIEVELLLFAKKGVDADVNSIKGLLRDVTQIDEVEVLLANLKTKVGEGGPAPAPSKVDQDEKDALLGKVTTWTFDGYKVEGLRSVQDLAELRRKVAETETRIAKSKELSKTLLTVQAKSKEPEVKRIGDMLKDPSRMDEAASAIDALKKAIIAEAPPPPGAVGVRGPKVDLYLKLLGAFVQGNKEVLSTETLRSTQSNLRRQHPKLFYLVIEKDNVISGDLPESEETLEALKAFLSYLYDFIGTYSGPDKDTQAVLQSLGPFYEENKARIDELDLAKFLPPKFLDVLAKKEVQEPPLEPLVLGELQKAMRTIAAIKIFERLYTLLFRRVIEKRANIIDKSLRMIKELRTTAPFIESFDVSPSGRTRLEVGKVKVRTLVTTLSKVYDFMVDIAGLDLGKDEANGLAKAVCAEVLEPLVPLPDKLEITTYILKGALSTKLQTGIPGFDGILAGGLPKDSSIILQAPSGIEKDVFVLQYLKKGLEMNEAALIILSNQSPQRFREKMHELGLDTKKYEDGALLKIIDWYSFRTESIVGVEEDGAVIKSSLDLTNVGIALNKALKGTKEQPVGRAVVDIISPASQSFEFEIIYRFAQVTKAKLRNNNYTTLFTVDKDMHDAQTLSSFHQIFDGVIEISKVRDGNKVVTKVGIINMRDTYFETELRTLEFGNNQVFIPEDEIGKVGEEEKKFYKDRLAAWTAAGYNVSQLEAILEKDIDTIEETFVEVDRSITRLEDYKKELAGMDVKGLEKDAEAIKTKLTDITKVAEVRTSLDTLKACIEEDEGFTLEGGEGIDVAEVPLHAKPIARGKPMMDVGGYHDGKGLIDGVGIIEGASGPTQPPKPVRPLVDKAGLINGQGMINGNGRVNGRGLVNGRGRVNGRGLVNGQGRVNGRGLVNGRGRVNGRGLVNGKGRGLVNGKGLINGQGLINGKGLINGQGLTNGKGLQNGRRRFKPVRPVRKKTNPWVMLAASILVVLIIFSAVIVASKYNLLGQQGVFINGNFDDWKGANMYPDQANDQSVNPDVNIVKFGAQRDSKYLSFFVKVQGTVMNGHNAGLDSLSIYVDGDKNYNTGYHIGNIGADYLLRLEGYNNKIYSKNFWRFNTSRDPLDFNGFSAGLRVSASNDGSQLEAQTSLADTNMKKDTIIACLAIMEDKDGNMDSSFVFSDKKGALVSTLTFTAQGHLRKGQNVELGRVILDAYMVPADVTGISLMLKGSATSADFGTITLTPDIGGASYTGSISGTIMSFNTGAMKVAKDSSTVLKVMADISNSAVSGHTIGLKFAGPDAVSTDATTLTEDEGPSTDAYIDTPTTKIVIDGAFEDWTTIPSIPDPAKDTSNPNIDLRDVRYSSDALDIYFYFRVDGKVMMGMDSPRALIRPTPGPGGNPGPQPELPVLNGGDVAYILIDGDKNASTGYRIQGIGADYILEVLGRNGAIERSDYMRFNGKNQNTWSWLKLAPIDSANDNTQVECSVVASSVGIESKGFMAIVEMTDWQKHTDMLDQVISAKGSNRTLAPDHPDVLFQTQLDLNGPLHAPEFKDLAVPIVGTIVVVVMIRTRSRKARK